MEISVKVKVTSLKFLIFLFMLAGLGGAGGLRKYSERYVDGEHIRLK